MADVVETQVRGNATKAKDREAAIAIVRLDHIANVEKGAFILVLFTHEMEGVWEFRVAVRGSVINGGNEGDLPARAEVVHE